MVKYSNKVIKLEFWITDEPVYKVIGKLNLPFLNQIKYLNVSVSVLVFINFGISIMLC